MIMKLCMEQHVLKLYKVYKNDDPELILTHFKTMSNLAKLHKAKIPDERLQDHWSSGSETIAASDLKVRRSRHLIEYMKNCEYCFLTLAQGRVHTIFKPDFLRNYCADLHKKL